MGSGGKDIMRCNGVAVVEIAAVRVTCSCKDGCHKHAVVGTAAERHESLFTAVKGLHSIGTSR